MQNGEKNRLQSQDKKFTILDKMVIINEQGSRCKVQGKKNEESGIRDQDSGIREDLGSHHQLSVIRLKDGMGIVTPTNTPFRARSEIALPAWETSRTSARFRPAETAGSG